METAYIFFRGAAFTLILSFGIKHWLNCYKENLNTPFFLLIISTIAYLAVPFIEYRALFLVFVFLASLIPLFFFYLVSSIFLDSKNSNIRILIGILSAIFIILTILHTGLPIPINEQQSLKFIYVFTNIMKGLLILLSFGIIGLEWKSDLINERRNLRLFIFGLSASYIISVVLFESMLGESQASMQLEALNSIGIFLLLIILSRWFLFADSNEIFRTRKILLTQIPDEISPSDPKLGHTEQKWLEQLKKAFDEEKIYRNNELSISRLAQELDIQEHRLRHLINKYLGYRNFNDFLNHYRITEVADKLANPDMEKTPILTIAMNAGYASLAPFNRAFKAEFNETPSQYKNRHIKAFLAD